MSASVTLQVSRGDSHKVAAALTRLIGTRVIFNPRHPDATFDLDYKGESLWNVLDALSSEGDIHIGMEDFGHLRNVRNAFLSGERMAVCFQNVTAERLAMDLSFLTGRDVYVASGDSQTLVYYKGKGVTLEEMLAAVSLDSGVQIASR